MFYFETTTGDNGFRWTRFIRSEDLFEIWQEFSDDDIERSRRRLGCDDISERDMQANLW